MKNKDVVEDADDEGSGEPVSEEEYIERYGADDNALSQLLRFSQAGPFQGWETLSELKEPDRITHLRLRVLGWLATEANREIATLVTGKLPESNNFEPFLGFVAEKDLKLRVSNKRKGRAELVDLITGGKREEARRKFFRGR
jgi:hypothetical protein